MIGRASVLLGCCLIAGCYIYRPLAARYPEPATYLAVTLTDAGSDEPVVVPRAFVASVQERRVSGGRIALLAGGSVLALLATYRALGSGTGAVAPAGGSGQPR